MTDDNVFGVDPIIEDGQVEGENTVEETTEETVVEETTPDNGQVEETTEQEQPLILGKFKTTDDLAKAYQNLQSHATKLSQQAKTAPKQEQSAQPNEDAQAAAWFNKMLQEDPQRAVEGYTEYLMQKKMAQYEQKIGQQLQPIVQERQLNNTFKTLMTKYPDFTTYQEQMAQAIDDIGNEDPDLLNSPVLYEMAYHRAKTKALEEQMKNAFENGKKAYEDAIKQKKKINNETPKPTNEEDNLPPGISIVQEGDGIFL